MEQRKSKLMTMHKALHPRDYVNRLYMSRKQGGRGLDSIEDSVSASIPRLEDHIEKRRGRLITATRNITDNTRNQPNDKNQKTKVGRKTTLWPF